MFKEMAPLYLSREKRIPLSPEDRRGLTEATTYLMSVFESEGIVHWLDYGSLLGVMREGGIIPEDHDTDISYLACEFDKIKGIRDDRIFVKHEYTVDVDSYSIDIEPWKVHEGMMWRTNQIGRGFFTDFYMRRYDIFPVAFLREIVRIKWHGVWVRSFNFENAKALLRIRYGATYGWVFSRNIFFYLGGAVFSRNLRLRRHTPQFDETDPVNGEKVLLQHTDEVDLELKNRLRNFLAGLAKLF